MEQSPALEPFDPYRFLLEVSFYDLQYEHVKELKTSSIPKFMSQIGMMLIHSFLVSNLRRTIRIFPRHFDHNNDTNFDIRFYRSNYVFIQHLYFRSN
jgi:hypothetical protein